MAEFFARNFIAVYFFYGLSFFSMGLAVLLELGHSSELDFANALRPLAGFGLVHGIHEWFEMFLLIQAATVGPVINPWISSIRIIMLAVSFLMLVAFGARLITGPKKQSQQRMMIGVIALLWVVGLIWVISTQPNYVNRVVAADVYTRYALAIPGAALTVWGLFLQRRRFLGMGMQSFGRDVTLAALAFGLYGFVGQLFASPSVIFPSEYLNTEAFVRWFGFPVQVFRAGMACLAAIFIIRSMRAFEVENRRRISNLRDNQLAEQRRLEDLRSELLHRTVKTQESERQRIARELHDETGQTLTALGMGLRGLSEMIVVNPKRAIEQAKQLEGLSSAGIDELQRLVSGLHPPQLDDLGIVAALRWYAGDITDHFQTKIDLNIIGTAPALPDDIRIVLFRIAQEAITNVIRHAGASKIILEIVSTPERVILSIEDNGNGFDVEEVLSQGSGISHCWGLLGMQERASLVSGTCEISSYINHGTRVEVSIPLVAEAINA